MLYCLLGYFIPCIPTLLLWQEAMERYNIEGDTMGDVGTSVCCTPCVICQTSVEIKARGTVLKKKKQIFPKYIIFVVGIIEKIY